MWALVLIVPLVFDPQGKAVFRPPKLYLAEVLGLLSVLTLSWRMQLDRSRIEAAALLRSTSLRIAGVLVAAAAVSIPGGSYREQGARALVHLAIGLVCLVAWSEGLGVDRLGALLRGSTVSASALAAVAIFQFFDLWQPFDFATAQPSARAELTSFAGASGDLAAFLVLPALVAQAAVAESGKARKKVWIAISLLLIATAFLTQNLTAIVALLVGSLVYWGWRLSARRRLVIVGLLVAVAVIAVATFPPLRQRVAKVAKAAEGGELNAALSGRLDGWAVAVEIWKEHPVFGVGHGAYGREFGQVKLRMAEQGGSFYRRHVYSQFDAAHNDPLQLLAEWGVVGVAAWLLALFWYFGALRRLGREAARLGWSGTVALALISLAYFPWRMALTAYPGLLFLAWVIRSGTDSPTG